MDIKVEIKEEFCSKDYLKTIKTEAITSDSDYDINIKREVKNDDVVSNFLLENEEEFDSKDPLLQYNNVSKDGEFEAKLEIKEEQCWVKTISTENLSIYDDLKNATVDNNSPNVLSFTSDLLTSDDLRNDICLNMKKNSTESARKWQSQDTNATNKTLKVVMVDSEMPGNGEILNLPPCLKQDDSFQESNTNKEDIKKEDHNSILNCEYKEAYKCDICDEGFNDLSNLKKHKLIHQPLKPIKCNICDRAFTRLQYLKAHEVIHKGVNPYKCEFCDNSFTQLHHLNRHKLIHKDIKSHKCHICNQTYTRLEHLKSHEWIHKDINPYKCSSCDKTYTRLQYLKAHELIHKGINPYKCDVCDKVFTRLYHLNRHKLTHKNIKPYKCDVCDKCFTELSSVKRHKLTHET